MRTLLAPGILTLGIVAACSSSSSNSGGTLDCGALQGNNCWKTTAAAAQSCLPDATATGTLSADGKTCTYANGIVVNFATPVTLPLPQGATWNFTVNGTNQQLCFHFENVSHQSAKLTTSAGSASTDVTSSGAYSLSCPDGSSLLTTNALSLLSCDGGFGVFPGSEWSSTTAGGKSNVSFGLLGTGSPSAFHVFTCSQ
jgi:hypothetical protein